jgi:hypothetical protein
VSHAENTVTSCLRATGFFLPVLPCLHLAQRYQRGIAMSRTASPYALYGYKLPVLPTSRRHAKPSLHCLSKTPCYDERALWRSLQSTSTDARPLTHHAVVSIVVADRAVPPAKKCAHAPAMAVVPLRSRHLVPRGKPRAGPKAAASLVNAPMSAMLRGFPFVME